MNKKILDYQTILCIEGVVGAYIDYLSKSNEMWRKSQEEIADLILTEISSLKKYSGAKQ